MIDPVCITGAGIVGAFGTGAAAFADGYARAPAATSPRAASDFDPVAFFGKRVAKAHDRVTQLLMAAAELALRHAALPTLEARRAHFADDEVGIVIGTFGSLKSVTAFDLQTLRAPEQVTATQFPSTVFCAPASFTAIHCSIRESCVTLTNGETASLQAFALGVARLTHASARQVLVGGAEELDPLRSLVARAAHPDASIAAEGAAVFALERRSGARARGAAELAEVLGASSSFCPDVARAYAANLARLHASIGPDEFAAIRHVFSAESSALDERAPLERAVMLHAPSVRLGHVGSASGAFAVAAMLADPRVERGARVLVNGVSAEGNATSVVFRKLGGLARAA